MITGIKKKNKLTEIWFDETGSAVNIRTYNTDLKNRLTAYAVRAFFSESARENITEKVQRIILKNDDKSKET